MPFPAFLQGPYSHTQTYSRLHCKDRICYFLFELMRVFELASSLAFLIMHSDYNANMPCLVFIIRFPLLKKARSWKRCLQSLDSTQVLLLNYHLSEWRFLNHYWIYTYNIYTIYKYIYIAQSVNYFKPVYNGMALCYYSCITYIVLLNYMALFCTT